MPAPLLVTFVAGETGPWRILRNEAVAGAGLGAAAHLAMHEGAVDWVSQQVPDGHDWLEYMMVGPGSTVPEDHVDPRELGVLNHFSIGVPNMEAAVTRLYAEDRLPERHDGPSMGRDGKWQANLYDPDGTRIELMEYHAVAKPCCSSFTAADPTP